MLWNFAIATSTLLPDGVLSTPSCRRWQTMLAYVRVRGFNWLPVHLNLFSLNINGNPEFLYISRHFAYPFDMDVSNGIFLPRQPTISTLQCVIVLLQLCALLLSPGLSFHRWAHRTRNSCWCGAAGDWYWANEAPILWSNYSLLLSPAILRQITNNNNN